MNRREFLVAATGLAATGCVTKSNYAPSDFHLPIPGNEVPKEVYESIVPDLLRQIDPTVQGIPSGNKTLYQGDALEVIMTSFDSSRDPDNLPDTVESTRYSAKDEETAKKVNALFTDFNAKYGQ